MDGVLAIFGQDDVVELDGLQPGSAAGIAGTVTGRTMSDGAVVLVWIDEVHLDASCLNELPQLVEVIEHRASPEYDA